MRRYILLILLSITTGIKAQTFTEADPALTNFDGIVSGSIAWGDYNNDGHLDVLLTGQQNSSGTAYVTKVYRNKGDGSFENSGISLPGAYRGQAAWADYDNDGYLDIIITGLTVGRICMIYHNKGDGTFQNSNLTFEGVYDAAVAWGDYDNDGYLDLLVTGLNNSNTPSTWLYRNKRDGTFENSGVSFLGLRNNSQAAAWADYDNDGHLDLVVAGVNNVSSPTPLTKLYHNKGDGTFEDSNTPLIGVWASATVTWGDYDNDGDQDLLLSGRQASSLPIIKLYRNKGDGTFEDAAIAFPNNYYAVVAWGDYDNDGDLDIVLTGLDINTNPTTILSKIYRNKGDGTFENSGIPLPGFSSGSMSWGDYDNDGDLDLLMAGHSNGAPASRIYINNSTTPNTKPNAPTGLQAILSPDNKSATLSWQKATDAQTAQAGLSYNIYISEQLSPTMANITNGYRRVAATGNAGQRITYTVKGLKPGKKYYWSVQAVDAAFEGSAFAAQQEFTAPLFTPLNSTEAPLWGLTDAAAWGDYDNDGDLDVVLNSGTSALNSACRLYRNKGNGTFEDSNIPLTSSYNASAAWADYDNDGYLDLMLGGNNPTKLYRNKGDGTFEVNNNTAFPTVNSGAFAWSDFDNDGDLDVFFVTYTGSALYRNKGDGTFENTGNTFLNISRASAAWGDYDNDGDPDIMISGQMGNAFLSKLYRNKGDGTFEDSGVPFTGLGSANSIAWGDYDNDGDLDLLIAGYNTTSTGLTKLYRNNGNGTFSDSGTPLENTFASALAWGDYDNDGYLDILLTGYGTPNHHAKIYRNKRDGTFEEVIFTSPGMYGGAATWMDFDNDGDLDFFISGSLLNVDVARIYRNNLNVLNTIPQTPATLQASLANDSTALLTWQRSSDAETPQAGLNYNVYISDVPGKTNVQTPMANITNGYRRIPAIGNTVINSDTIKGLLPGKTYYWSVQAIDAAFAGSPFAAERSFTTRNIQTISFSNITATYGDADFTPVATSTSSLPLDFSSDNAGVATIVGGKIHITGAGTANIKASQAGNPSFRPADVTVTITVSKKMLTVTGDDKAIIYGDALPTLTYTVAGLVPGETESMFSTAINISTTAIAGSNVGVYDIEAAAAVADNYTFTYVKGKLTIQEATSVITFNALPAKIYGDADFAPGATIPNGLPITYSSGNTNVATIVNGNIHIVGAGTATITAKQSGDQNHTPSVDVTVTLTVSKKQLTVTAADKTMTYGDALPVLTYNITGFVPGDTESVFTIPVSITTDANGDAGVFNITVSGAAADNYDLTYQQAHLTVQQATVPISFSSLPVKIYGDADFNPGATIPNGLPVTYSSANTNVATIIGGNIHIVGVGTTTITAHQVTGNNNYTPATDVPVTFTVSKKQLTVTATDQTITYGDALPVFTYTVTGFANGETEAVFTTPVSITGMGTDVGTYPITTSNAVAANYDFTYQPGTLTIQKATAQINFTNLPMKTYGDADFAPGATIPNGLPVTYSSSNGNVATIINGNIHITGTGTTTITAHQAGNNNYTAATDAPLTLVVRKKQLTVTAENKTKIYGEPTPALTYIISGFIPGETEAVFSTPVNIATSGTDVGTYPITASNAAAANYDFIYQPGTLTIQKAASQIIFNNLPVKTYGDADFNLNAVADNGLPVNYSSGNANVATIINGTVHITGAGTALITASQSGNDNYTAATDVSLVLIVIKKVLTVTPADQTKTYGAPNPVFNYTITGFVPGEDESAFSFPLYVNSTGVNAGTYPITASNAAAANYDFAYHTGTFTIHKAAQTITFNSLPAKTYGDADFSANATSNVNLPVTYTSSDPNVATIVNGNIHITGAGIVTITASQPGNNNYNAGASISQQLIVNKAAQTIQFPPMTAKTKGAPAFDPGARASSGLPVSYVIENVNIATLNGNSLSPIRPGFTKVTATQPGNNNYEPATPVEQELEVTTGSQLVVQDAVTPNGDGINDYLLIEGIRQFPDNQLYISNAQGKIVFEAKGYNNTNNVFKGFAGTGSNRLSRGVYYYVLFYGGKKQSGFFVLEY